MGHKVVIGSVMHETNSFSQIETNLASFHVGRSALIEGQDVVTSSRGTYTGLGGMIEVGDAAGWDIIGTVSGHATPSANVQAAAYDELKNRLLGYLRKAGEVDGVLLYLHGAMLAENAPDAEGDLCRAVRDVVGADVPIIVELDLHGNITAEMCKAVNAVYVYRTNPHIDSYERGIEAARCMQQILDGTLAMPQVCISKPPMIPPTINMRTAEGPMRELIERGVDWEAHPGIVTTAVFGGFAYADFDQVGTALVVTATNPELGQRCADNLGRAAWEMRESFLKTIPSPEEALDQALAIIEAGAKKPVVLADVADNPGGGGSGDTTELLRVILERGVPGAAACIWDPETVQQAMEAGIGAELDFRIAGKAGPADYGLPLEMRGRVTRLSDGYFVGHGPVVRGRTVFSGPSACIDVNGFKLVVTSVRHAANDRGYFKMVGVVPEEEPLLVVKSRGHFRADFEPIAEKIIEVDAPGAANPMVTRYPFQNVRRPVWPLDPDTTWEG